MITRTVFLGSRQTQFRIKVGCKPPFSRLGRVPTAAILATQATAARYQRAVVVHAWPKLPSTVLFSFHGALRPQKPWGLLGVEAFLPLSHGHYF